MDLWYPHYTFHAWQRSPIDFVPTLQLLHRDVVIERFAFDTQGALYELSCTFWNQLV